jgi:threonine/homoserine/homoserine lactone efflux protein
VVNESTSYLSFGIFYLLAVISPGPSLIVILKNSMRYSWKHGVFTSVGTVSGICLQSLVTLNFFNFIVKQDYVLSSIGIILSVYLCYIGCQHMVSLFRNKHSSGDIQFDTCKSKVERTLISVWKEGFIVDVLNPMALIFFFTIFSVHITPSNSLLVNFLYWIEVIFIGFLWYVGFAFLISIKFLQEIIFVKMHKVLNFAMSVMLLFLAARIFIDNLSKLGLGYVF